MVARVRVRHGGAARLLTSVKAKHLGSLRTIRTIKVMNNGVLRTVYSAASSLSASADDSTVVAISEDATISTQTVTITPSGGQAPYNYSWAVTSFTGSPTPTISSASFASTYFTQTGVSASDSAVFTCTVTDNLGDEVEVAVNVTFIRNSGD
jgi:hypothetical protein